MLQIRFFTKQLQPKTLPLCTYFGVFTASLSTGKKMLRGLAAARLQWAEFKEPCKCLLPNPFSVSRARALIIPIFEAAEQRHGGFERIETLLRLG